MGNAAAKPRQRMNTQSPSTCQQQQQAFSSRPSTNHRKISTSSSSTSTSTSDDYLDAQVDLIHPNMEEELEEFIGRGGSEDAFMKAVLSFCAHMRGRMDTLDNTMLYDEFCSYSAGHIAKMGVA